MILELLNKYKLSKTAIIVKWDTQNSYFECYYLNSKKKIGLEPELSDALTDFILDTIELTSHETEFSKGTAILSNHIFEIKIVHKKRFEQSTEITFGDFEHPKHVLEFTKRANIHFSFHYNFKNFSRMSIKPEIFEGDAFTFSTETNEYYRIFFEPKLKELFAHLNKGSHELEHEILITHTLSLSNSTKYVFTRVHFEYVEENLVLNLSLEA